MPYNSFLSIKYNCHINVEVATTVTAVKYLFKYVYKGNNRSVFVPHTSEQSVDEIADYLDGRYISPAEACYRLFAYDITEHFPSVTRLAVHLEDEQSVAFVPRSAPANQFPEAVKPSSLQSFFAYCEANPRDVRDLLYPDAPTRLTWVKAEGRWKKRGTTGRRSIGRASGSLQQGER